MYKPMGVKRAADRTTAQSCSFVPFCLSACHNNYAPRINVDLRYLIPH